MNHQESIESFREKLETEYEWPSLYTFKFIVPREKVDEVRVIFKNHDITEKESSKGKYISVTSKMMSESSQHIIDIYLEANKIEGLIAL
jgi:putative lipoic acid-binding regulatory protein